MTPRVIKNSRLFRLPLLRDFDAICLGRFIFCKGEPSDSLLRHEMVHQAQMDRYTVAGFYALYVFYWLKALATHRDFSLAYSENPLEKEAYEKEKT